MRYLFLLVLLFGSYAFADDLAINETAKRTTLSVQSIKETLNNCEYNQSTMNTCAEYKYVVADLALNEAYNKLKTNLDGRDIKLLVAAQRAWISFRDQNCSFESSDVLGGSMWPMVNMGCLEERTIERTNHLKTLISCTSIHGNCE